MIELETSDGTKVAISPIHVVGVVKSFLHAVVLTDHPGKYSEIEVSDSYEHLRTILEDELYGYEKRS